MPPSKMGRLTASGPMLQVLAVMLVPPARILPLPMEPARLRRG